MANLLRQSTQIKVRVGPFVDATDGLTPETGVALSTADEAELLKADGAATVDISGATWAAITGADGWYDLTLTTSHTDTVGELVVVVNDDSVCLPVFARFQVVEEATYDFLYAASATPVADINAEVDTALTDYDAVVPADLPTNFGDLSITATTGRVDIAAVAGTAQTAGDIPALVTTVDTVVDGIQTDLDNGTDGLGAIKADTAAILVDTNELQTDDVPGLIAALNDPTAATIADAVWDEAQADHVAAGSFGETATEIASILDDTDLIDDGTSGLAKIATDVAAVLVDTADMQPKIGTPAADVSADIAAVKAETALIVADTNELQTDDVPGLIAALNDVSTAQVNTEVDNAIVTYGLDHLVSAAVVGADVADNSVVAKLVSASATADFDDFVNTTDSMQAIRDHVGDGTNLTEAGGDGDHLTAINLPNQTMDITGDITGNLSGSVGSVTGAVGSVTGAVGSVTAEVTADVTKISGSAPAADNLEASALGIVSTTVNDASASTTAFVTALTEATDDHYNGRIVVFTSGDVAGQATDITDYTGSTKTLTVTALTEAPANGVSFVIV